MSKRPECPTVDFGDILYTIGSLSPLDEAPTYIASEIQKVEKELQRMESELEKDVESVYQELVEEIEDLAQEVERLNNELRTYQYLFPQT